MKKNIALFWVLLICISLSACSPHPNQKVEINKTLSKLLTALENNDEAAILDLFAPAAKSSMDEKLNVQINEMMEYFEGEIISYKKIETVGGMETTENGKIVYSAGSGTSRSIKTTEAEYKLSLSMIFVNNENKTREGVWLISISKSDDDYMVFGKSYHD